MSKTRRRTIGGAMAIVALCAVGFAGVTLLRTSVEPLRFLAAKLPDLGLFSVNRFGFWMVATPLIAAGLVFLTVLIFLRPHRKSPNPSNRWDEP